MPRPNCIQFMAPWEGTVLYLTPINHGPQWLFTLAALELLGAFYQCSRRGLILGNRVKPPCGGGQASACFKGPSRL